MEDVKPVDTGATKDEEEIVVNPDLSAEEEANLARFLKKVQKGIKIDGDVPDFVGDQVNQWLTELQPPTADAAKSEPKI